MDNSLFEDLHSHGLLSDTSLGRIKQRINFPLFSVHRELQALLYIGVLALSSGLGTLVYKNIDSIGHQTVLAFIACLCLACFYWCNKYKLPFSFAKAQSENPIFDYILLLGTLSFLSFIGYLQFQYVVFGDRLGLATFIPMITLFFISYYYDHLGALTLAIVNLAIWMGVAVTPKALLKNLDYNSETFIYTYLILGTGLLVVAYVTYKYDIKKHFFFSYHNYGVHVTFIALLSGFFFYNFPGSLIWLLLTCVLAWFTISRALKDESFYFLLVSVFYSYVAISGLWLRLMKWGDYDMAFELSYLYFIGSGLATSFLIVKLNKTISK
jgi:hypothetical protein